MSVCPANDQSLNPTSPTSCEPKASRRVLCAGRRLSHGGWIATTTIKRVELEDSYATVAIERYPLGLRQIGLIMPLITFVATVTD